MGSVGALLQRVSARLRGAGIDDAVGSAHLLLRAALRRAPEDWSAPLPAPGAALDARVRERLDALCELRCARWPIQYLAGEWDFHGINLVMRPPTLIPRPETEVLVDRVLASVHGRLATAMATATAGAGGAATEAGHDDDTCMAMSGPQPAVVRVLDVGCGTGAIGLALLAGLRETEGLWSGPGPGSGSGSGSELGLGSGSAAIAPDTDERRLHATMGAKTAEAKVRVEVVAIDCCSSAVSLSRYNAWRLGFSTSTGTPPRAPPPLPPLSAAAPELQSAVAAIPPTADTAEVDTDIAASTSAFVDLTYSCHNLSIADLMLELEQREQQDARRDQGQELSVLSSDSLRPCGRFDVVVSNPPYVPSADVGRLQAEVRDFESHVALDGGVDGLGVVRELLAAAPMLLRRGEQDPELWLETGGGHPAVIERWLGAHEGEAGKGGRKGDAEAASEVEVHENLRCIETFSDLNGVARFIGIGLRDRGREAL